MSKTKPEPLNGKIWYTEPNEMIGHKYAQWTTPIIETKDVRSAVEWLKQKDNEVLREIMDFLAKYGKHPEVIDWINKFGRNRNEAFEDVMEKGEK